MQLSVIMDPSNPRWETSDQRTRRSATMWKIIVGAAGASALTAVVVASCVGGDVAQRDLEEPAYVETTSATTTTRTATPATTRDSTGGIALPAAPNGGADTASAPAPTSQEGTTTVTSAPMAAQVFAQQHEPNYTPVRVPFDRASGDSSTSGVAGTTAATTAGVSVDAGPNAGHASHANNDPNNAGSNPDSPPMSAGAGRFITEAPYWSGTAWTSDADAGAGRFETERNTPAR